MNSRSRYPLFMALALAFGAALVYVVWMFWQIGRLGTNSVVASSSVSVPRSALLESADKPASDMEIPPVHEPAPLPAPAPMTEEEIAAGTGETKTEATNIVFTRHVDGEPGSAPTPLQVAQAALARGDVEAARRQFADLSRADPRHLEALLGLAAIALRRNEPEAAWRFYQAAWTAHPQDARAQAGMLALLSAVGQIDPQGAERRLKALIVRQPQAAAPHFALGNLLSGQERWPEAQAAYFEACRWEPDNPDYRFNLAVSLDALRQDGLAATHYHAALAAAETAPASFALADVRARLEVLRDILAREETP
jgi:tetratricopeptide (TPR) repeat protein